MDTQEIIAAARRRPLAAGGAFAAILAAGVATFVLTASSAAADAPLTGAAPASTAPAGRVMGWEVDGFGRAARVHSVEVDAYGAPLAYTIRRANWHGFGWSLVTVAPEDLAWLPREQKLAAAR